MKRVGAVTLPQSDFEGGTMAAELHDPSKPAGHLIEKREDGRALRNDGVELKPASQNSSYVLATVYGEYGDNSVDMALHEVYEKNRRILNGWISSGLSDKERRAVVEKTGLPESEFDPLTEEELHDLHAAFLARVPDTSGPPDPFDAGDFSGTHFLEILYLSYYCILCGRFDYSVFSSPFSAGGSIFVCDSNFYSASFHGDSDFRCSIFMTNSIFVTTCFEGWANFSSAQIFKSAYFDHTRFEASII